MYFACWTVLQIQYCLYTAPRTNTPNGHSAKHMFHCYSPDVATKKFLNRSEKLVFTLGLPSPSGRTPTDSVTKKFTFVSLLTTRYRRLLHKVHVGHHGGGGAGWWPRLITNQTRDNMRNETRVVPEISYRRYVTLSLL